MPFAYFQRLTRRQQAIYLKSDAVTEMPLARPETLRPLVGELARALESGERAPTESSTQCLASGLARALDLPPVRVTVLAARPHARWGELHGLYETTGRPADTPLITLWMRTARQKRVVAFRTFLRTLLHEIGHHVDYTRLRLGDSFHTQGFYQRESHLFHQLVTDGGQSMATPEEQMARMDRTADDLLSAIKGTPEPSPHQAPRRQELVAHRGAVPPARYRGVVHGALSDHHGHGRAQVSRLSSPTAGHRSGSTSATTRGRRSRRFGSGATSRSSSCAGSGPSRWHAAACTPRAGA